MARSGSWQRGSLEYYPDDDPQSFTYLLLYDYAPGQTIVRSRFRYNLLHVPSEPSEAAGLGATVGLGLFDSDTPPDASTGPWNDPNNPRWIWWECTFFKPELVSTVDGVLAELDTAPPDPGERDSHAERIVVGYQSLYLVTQLSTLSPMQAAFYPSASWSIYALDAP